MDLNSFSFYVIEKYREIQGEQQTKNNLIEPLLENLGYSIDCSEDIKTEVTCDVGIKTEKVDYVLCISDIPKILVEAKDCHIRLCKTHINQLYRYYAASDCKMAILTNGIEYWFFADFNKENIMDSEPFYKINMLSPRTEDNEILNAICKVQQCCYPVEQFICEKKTEKLLASDEMAKLIAINYFHNEKTIDAVQKALTNMIH